MLTPVRSASNTSLSSQGQTAAVSGDVLVRASSAVAPVHQVQSADLNSSVAGKLNILLLAVRARMVDALLDVLNATSEAVSIPREEDEPDLAFASRLAAAIQKLPPAKIEQLERQLAMQGHAVPLRLLAEALRNPAGPEAARIATYLETIRYKDRDLATRAVVRSYGQNDASPPRQEQRGEISIHRDNLTVAPGAPVTTKREPEAPRQTALVAAAYLDADSAPVQPIEHSADKPITKPAVEATVEEALPEIGEVLDESIASGEKVEPAQEAAQAGTHDPVSKGDPIIPKSWAAIPASLSDDTTKLIVTIIRDQEAEALLEVAGPDPAVEIDIILDETILADLPEELIALHDRAPSLPEGVARQSPLVPEQPVSEAAATTAKKHPAPEISPPLIVQQAIDETYAPVLMKIVEGVPYAMQPYDFSKDEADDSGAREMHRQDHNGGESSEEEDAEKQGEPSNEEPTGVVIDDEAAAALAARESAIKAGTPPHRPAPPLPMAAANADDAYMLYRRKVDWE